MFCLHGTDSAIPDKAPVSETATLQGYSKGHDDVKLKWDWECTIEQHSTSQGGISSDGY